jgi:trans-aconitate methyltransferase
MRRRWLLDSLAISDEGQTARVLELGSGTGEFAEALLTRHPRVRFQGLELSAVGVGIASRRVPAALFFQQDLLQSPSHPEASTFNATHAVCSEVLEHIDNPVQLLVNARQYMAPGCRLVITVPGGPMSAFDRHIGHRRHFTTRSLQDQLQQAGFRVEETIGIGFPFFNLYRLTIIWRGQRLAHDIQGTPSNFVRLGMNLFRTLFRFNTRHRGWQITAIAIAP